MYLECIVRAHWPGDEANPFRLRRGDMSYRISASRFGAVKRRLLKADLISRHFSGTGRRLRDYFKLVEPVMNG